MTNKYVSTYDQIREGKINTAKDLFRKLSGFEACADIFTEDDLVRTFDFFNKHVEEEDDEAADIGMWVDFLEESVNFLSEKAYKLLRICNE